MYKFAFHLLLIIAQIILSAGEDLSLKLIRAIKTGEMLSEETHHWKKDNCPSGASIKSGKRKPKLPTTNSLKNGVLLGRDGKSNSQWHGQIFHVITKTQNAQWKCPTALDNISLTLSQIILPKILHIWIDSKKDPKVLVAQPTNSEIMPKK